MESTEWIKDLFASIDAKDAAAFVSFLSHDANFTYGNLPTVSGKENIQQAVADFFSAIKALKHDIQKTWTVDEHTLIVEGQVTYTRQDDSTLTVPFCDVFELEGPKIQEYRIYIDISQLFNAA